MIDEFPVWNSEPDQPTMMSWAAVPEREKVSEFQSEIWCIDDRSSLFLREMEGAGAVWVVYEKRVNLSQSTFYCVISLRELFKKKKVWNFPYFSGVGGFEKVIFYKKNMKHGLKMPKFHLKATYFFKYGGWSDT